MQLASDASALLGDRLPGVLLTRLLQPRRALLGRLGARGPTPQGETRQPHDREQPREHVVARGVVRIVDDDDRDGGEDDRQAEAGPATVRQVAEQVRICG